jgi:hypothetical protein
VKLNTVIKLPDGRVGTICWNNLDGSGGVWGRHTFDMPKSGFGNLPAPEFMLRNKSMEALLRRVAHIATMECVGEEFEVLDERIRTRFA